MAPRVSVIVPLFNKAPHVRRCVDSILAQTLRDFELIVVDDGSTDDGARLVEAYADRRVRVIAQANAGPGAARNRGVQAATGEYIAFLDADDEWMPTYLQRGIALLAEQPQVACVSSGYLEGLAARSSEGVWAKRGIHDSVIALTPSSSAQLAVHVLACMSPCTTIAQRWVFERWGGFNDTAARINGEDNELWLKVLLNETVAVYSEPLVYWHSEASELSRNVRGPRLVEIFLLHPEGLYDACPPDMRELLRQILAIRACKTACMLGFWGQGAKARGLVKRFSTVADLRWSWVRLGNLCATPLGALAGSAIRKASAVVPGGKRWGSASWG